ncbi:MAG: hypothetical protein ACI8WB_001904 [Phenylobacterium sp.]|jgi:hypothetical protein
MTIKPQPLTLVVLAGGLGTRFGGAKQLTTIAGLDRTIMELSISDAVKAGVTAVVLVINPQIKSQVEAQILPRLPSHLTVHLAVQEIGNVPMQFKHLAKDRRKPWGTGHALLAARPFVSGKAMVITADDYYGASAYQLLANELRSDKPASEAHWSMVGYPIMDTLSAQGGVNRGICQLDKYSDLQQVVEYLDIQHQPLHLPLPQHSRLTGINPQGQRETIAADSLVSMTLWGFDQRLFDYLALGFAEFLSVDDSVVEKEYYLPDQIQNAIDTQQIKVSVLRANEPWLGMTYRSELNEVTEQLNKKLNKAFVTVKRD